MSGAVEAARQSHHGVFITAPGRVELRRDRLPESWFESEYVITESLGNSVCSSDQKAVRQFTDHAADPRQRHPGCARPRDRAPGGGGAAGHAGPSRPGGADYPRPVEHPGGPRLVCARPGGGSAGRARLLVPLRRRAAPLQRPAGAGRPSGRRAGHGRAVHPHPGFRRHAPGHQPGDPGPCRAVRLLPRRAAPDVHPWARRRTGRRGAPGRRRGHAQRHRANGDDHAGHLCPRPATAAPDRRHRQCRPPAPAC